MKNVCSTKLMRLIRYGMSGQFVFHGSPTCIDGLLLPNHTTRVTADDRVMYDGISLHATRLLYVSLTYLAGRSDTLECTSGVDLFKATNTIVVSCEDPSQTKQAVFDMLYSRGGYVYVLPAERFTTTKGLGLLEVISLEAVQPVHRVRLSKNDLSALLKMLGTRIDRWVMHD